LNKNQTIDLLVSFTPLSAGRFEVMGVCYVGMDEWGCGRDWEGRGVGGKEGVCIRMFI
jgi:hypothetical protein